MEASALFRGCNERDRLEEAHIVAEGDQGPRADASVSSKERNAYPNLRTRRTWPGRQGEFHLLRRCRGLGGRFRPALRKQRMRGHDEEGDERD